MWRITGYSSVIPLAPSTDRAVRATSNAIRTLSTNVMHGRNYQHLDTPVGWRNLDLERLEELRRAHMVMELVKLDLVDAMALGDLR